MLVLWLTACIGDGPEVQDPPIPGEAVLADTVQWRLYDGGWVVRALEHDGGPALAVSMPNNTAGTGYAPTPTPLGDATVVRVLAPPFVGGSVFDQTAASVVDDQHVMTMEAADWTGDGVEDLAVHLRLFAGPFLGDAEPEPVASWFWTTEEVSCDLDANGVLDLCTTVGPVLGPLSGAYAASDAAFSVAVAGEPGLEYSETVRAGDATGDGRQDLILSDWNATRTRLEVYLLTDPLSSTHWDLYSDADVTWHDAGALEQEQLQVTSDLDGDGTRDLLVAPGGSAFLVTEKTGGELGDAATRIEGFGSAVASGDLDGDGQTDVVASSVGSRVGQVAIWLGPFSPGTYGRLDAAAIWKGTEQEEDAFGYHLLLSDLDLDGRDDLVVTATRADPDGVLHLLWGGNL